MGPSAVFVDQAQLARNIREATFIILYVDFSWQYRYLITLELLIKVSSIGIKWYRQIQDLPVIMFKFCPLICGALVAFSFLK